MHIPRIRLLIIVLFALLCLGLLGACGANAPSPGNGTPAATSAGY